VHDSVDNSVCASVDASVDDSMRASVDASRSSRHPLNARADLSDWHRIFGGQLWVGGWYAWGNAHVDFMLDALRLDIGRQQELKARAYAATAMSACWWYPTTHFVIVSERPSSIEWEGTPVVGKRNELKRAAWTWTDSEGKRCEWSVP
jgi:hypothetical protein